MSYSVYQDICKPGRRLRDGTFLQPEFSPTEGKWFSKASANGHTYGPTYGPFDTREEAEAPDLTRIYRL